MLSMPVMQNMLLNTVKITMTDVMIDIETAGDCDNAIVLTLGAAKFDPNSLSGPGDSLYMRIDIEEQEQLGRVRTDSTMAWWDTQPIDVREEAWSPYDRHSVNDALSQLQSFVKGSSAIWSQGPLFDIIILQHLYQQIGLRKPWRYNAIRDSRTLFKTVGDFRDRSTQGLHNALVDAHHQILGVQRCMQIINRNKAEDTST